MWRVVIIVLFGSAPLYEFSACRAEAAEVFEEYGACGENSLFAIAAVLGSQVSYEEIRSRVDPQSRKETSLEQLASAANQIGLIPVGLSVTPEQSDRLKAPAILHLRHAPGANEGRHFAVYLGRADDGKLCVLDPPKSPKLISSTNLAKLWTGHALVICENEAQARDFQEKMDLANRPLWAEPMMWSAVGITLIPALLLRHR